jgi:hypothetical protein
LTKSEPEATNSKANKHSSAVSDEGEQTVLAIRNVKAEHKETTGSTRKRKQAKIKTEQSRSEQNSVKLKI